MTKNKPSQSDLDNLLLWTAYTKNLPKMMHVLNAGANPLMSDARGKTALIYLKEQHGHLKGDVYKEMYKILEKTTFDYQKKQPQLRALHQHLKNKRLITPKRRPKMGV